MLASSNAPQFTSSPLRTQQRQRVALGSTNTQPLTPMQMIKKQHQTLTKTAIVMTPPPGHQFLTAFDCKYYGTSRMAREKIDTISGRQVTNLVRETIKSNNRVHRKVWFRITDRGIRVTSIKDDTPELDLSANMLRRIVPGTLKTKTGKTFRVALVIERYPSADDMMTFHVFQFRQPEDVRFMYEASKRMWRDHMFSALLDVSSEGAQTEFDSFTIEQDIQTANERCNEIMNEDMFSFEAAMEGLLGPLEQ